MKTTATAKPKTLRHEGRRLPLWSPWRHGITFSLLDKWLSCRHQAYLQYPGGWTSKSWSLPLEFGSLVHWVLENISWGSGTADVETLAQLLARYRRYLKRTRANYSGVVDDVIHCLRLGGIVLPRYFAYWQEQDKKINWVAREGRFEQTMDIYPNVLNCMSTQIGLRGMIDGVYSLRGKSIWLFETKTKGLIDELGIQYSLPYDTQTLLYSVVAQLKYGRPVNGVLYNVIRRPGQRRRQGEHVEDFYHRVDQDMGKRPAYYFHRWQVLFPANHVNRFRYRQLEPMLEELIRWYLGFCKEGETELKTLPLDPFGNPHHYLTGHALLGRFGRCDMFEPITHHNYTGVYRRKHPHPELED